MPESVQWESVLRGRRLLVIEDDYFWADELSGGLRRIGATVLGPVGTVEAALALLGPEPELDAAVVDMNLRGERADPVVDRLLARNVPILLVTGYESASLADGHAGLNRLEKPVALSAVLTALSRMLGPR